MTEPLKVKFAQKCHSPVFLKEEHLKGGVLIRGDGSRESSIVLGEGGRRIIGPQVRPQQEPKAAKKLVPAPQRSEEPKVGKRIIPAPDRGQGEEIKHAERIHFEEKHGTTIEGIPTLNWTRKKTVRMPNGIPAARKEPDSYNLEASMNRKQRVRTELDARNQIPAASKGDKFYKQADREPEFYAKGGLVVGSTMTLKESAKPTLRKKEDGTHEGTPGKKLEATYAKLQTRLAQEYDMHQVHSLTVPSKDFQGQAVQSWEARTGNYLVDPGEESPRY